MEAKSRTKKVDRQNYADFLLSEQTQEALKSVPKHLQQRYLRKGFENQTGVKISKYMHYRVVNAMSRQVNLGGKDFVVL
jgi:intein-encoded DNA endonuclease-like protein